MRIVAHLLILFGALSLLLTGCGTKAPSAASPAPGVQGQGPPPTEEEAQKFADSLLQAVRDQDEEAFERIVRMSDLVERIVSDLSLPDAERRSFLYGAKNSLQRDGLGPQIIRALRAGGSYKLLRIHSVEGKPRPLFRLISGDDTVHYHDYTLARFPDGNVGMEDVYILMSGEEVSQTIRSLVIPALRSDDKDDALFHSADTLLAVSRLLRQGSFAEAMAAYTKLPKSVQERKSVLLLYIRAALLQSMRLGGNADREYLEAMEKFRQLYPSDACIDFVSVDYYLLKHRYDDALTAIDRVDASLGGDPYLNVIRCNILMEANRLDHAKSVVEKALKEEPALEQAYWLRIGISLREKRFDDTLAWLEKAVETCRATVHDLTQIPEYAEFVKSPQYAQWKEWYEKNRKS